MFQRNPPTTFLASQAGDLIFKRQVQPPGLRGTPRALRPPRSNFVSQRPPLPRPAPGLPAARPVPASRGAAKFPPRARARAGARPPPRPGPPRPPGECRRGPRPRPRPRARPGPLPAARPRALPAERRGACCFLLGMLLGPPQPSSQPRRSSRGAGTRGPGRGRNSAARPTSASPRGLRAPGSGRAADRGEPLAWTAAPGAAQEAAAAAARAASRPPGCGRSARGLGAEPGVIPGAGRGRSGGRSEGRPAARAPCCRLPPPGCCWRALPAPPSASRESPSATFSPPLLAARGRGERPQGAGRGSLIVRREADPGCPSLLHLV